MQTNIYIIGGSRTPMADYTGKLKDFSALELGAIAARAAMERSRVAPADVDHVVFGNVLQTSADAVYGARHVGLKAGVPIEVPALTVNRLCGSGIQAAISGGQMIQLGEADIVLTGGMESMSQAPHVIRGLRNGLRLGQGQLEDTLWSALLDTHWAARYRTAENCAASLCLREGRTATRLAASSSLMPPWKAAGSRRSGAGRNQVAEGKRAVFPRRSPAADSRDGRLRSCQRPSARMDVTAGNASGIVDGGAALPPALRRASSRTG
jgi:acetyl-CoA acetyltransferase